jgi:hypothetical protein
MQPPRPFAVAVAGRGSPERSVDSKSMPCSSPILETGCQYKKSWLPLTSMTNFLPKAVGLGCRDCVQIWCEAEGEEEDTIRQRSRDPSEPLLTPGLPYGASCKERSSWCSLPDCLPVHCATDFPSLEGLIRAITPSIRSQRPSDRRRGLLRRLYEANTRRECLAF